MEKLPRARLFSAGVCFLLLMTASASAQKLACSDPQQAMLEIDLLFGRNIGMELG